MWAAIFGDVVVVMSVTLFASLIVGPSALDPPRLRGWLGLIGVGLPLSVLLEWIPRALEWWEYSAPMPTIHVAGRELGLSPILQITLLPALSVHFACSRRYAPLA
jgi:hypothetical protein